MTATPQPARGLRVYRDLLAIPGTARFSFSAVLAHVPLPMVGMGLLIGVREAYGSYGTAGMVAAVSALSTAFWAPWIGRRIDVLGQRRASVPMIILWLAAAAAMILALSVRAPIPVVLLIAILLGALPPFGSMSRARWALVLREEPKRIGSALSLTSIIEECMWVIGNPLSALIATTIDPRMTLVVAMVSLAIGSWGLFGDARWEPAAGDVGRVASGRSARVRALLRMGAHGRQSGQDAPGGRRALDIAEGETVIPAAKTTLDQGAGVAHSDDHTLFSPALLSLLAVMFAYGGFVTTCGLAIVAFSQEQGQQQWSGVVLACFSTASMISALAYGAREWASPLWLRFEVGLVALALGCSALVFSQNMVMAGVVMFIAGLAQAPTVINVNQMILQLVPALRFTEGMAYMATMWVVGQSVTQFIAGQLIDAFGSRGGFLTVTGAAFLALVCGVAAMGPLKRGTAKPLSVGFRPVES